MRFTGETRRYGRSTGPSKDGFLKTRVVSLQEEAEPSLSLLRVTLSPTWYMRGGPQTAASGVVTGQSATVSQGLGRPTKRKALSAPLLLELAWVPVLSSF